MTPYQLENTIYSLNKREWVLLLTENNFILKEVRSYTCEEYLKLCKFKRSNDGYAWKCVNKRCSNYKKCFSIRIPFLKILIWNLKCF